MPIRTSWRPAFGFTGMKACESAAQIALRRTLCVWEARVTIFLAFSSSLFVYGYVCMFVCVCVVCVCIYICVCVYACATLLCWQIADEDQGVVKLTNMVIANTYTYSYKHTHWDDLPMHECTHVIWCSGLCKPLYERTHVIWRSGSCKPPRMLLDMWSRIMPAISTWASWVCISICMYVCMYACLYVCSDRESCLLYPRERPEYALVYVCMYACMPVCMLVIEYHACYIHVSVLSMH
jgi:hypothetical protein